MICRICHEPCNGRRHETVPLGTVHGIRPHFPQPMEAAFTPADGLAAIHAITQHFGLVGEVQ